MSEQDNKAVARRYYDEVLNQRNIGLLDDLAVEDYVEHDPFPGQGNGLADLKARVAGLCDKKAVGYFFFKSLRFFSASMRVLKFPTHTLYIGVLKTIVASKFLLSFLNSTNFFLEFSLSPLKIWILYLSFTVIELFIFLFSFSNCSNFGSCVTVILFSCAMLFEHNRKKKSSSKRLLIFVKTFIMN